MTYVKLFLDSLDLLGPLDDAERGRLLTALLNYAKSGEIPTFSGNERFLFPVFRQQYDRDAAQYEQQSQTRRANGARGGRPRMCKENQEVFSESEKSQDKDKDQDQDKDKDQVQDKDDDNDLGAAPSAGAEGDIAEVAAVAAVWEGRMECPMSPKGRQELAEFIRDMGTECCLRAFDAALDAGRPTWAYVRGILRTKREQGVRSPEDWDRLERNRAQAKRGDSSSAAQPDPGRIRRGSDWLESFLSGVGEENTAAGQGL